MPDVVGCVASFAGVSADWGHHFLDRRPPMGRSVRWRTVGAGLRYDCDANPLAAHGRGDRDDARLERLSTPAWNQLRASHGCVHGEDVGGEIVIVDFTICDLRFVGDC